MSTPLDSSDLVSLARRLLTSGPVKTYPASPRRVRILHGGRYIADSTAAVFVWEHEGYPFFYLPKQAFPAKDKDTPGGKHGAEGIKWTEVKRVTEHELIFGEEGAVIWKIEAGGKGTDSVVEFLKGELEGLVRVEFKSVDQWFEEDAPILVHPKDPFKRIICAPSTRQVRISLAGHTLATSSFAIHLFETGLPCRYYIPFTSVNQHYLRKSNTRTQCPYKGEAEYYDVVLPASEAGGEGEVYKDYIWYYNRPDLEVALVQGLACFYNEKVDIEVDGEKMERPKSFFS